MYSNVVDLVEKVVNVNSIVHSISQFGQLLMATVLTVPGTENELALHGLIFLRKTHRYQPILAAIYCFSEFLKNIHFG